MRDDLERGLAFLERVAKETGGHKWKGPFPKGWTDESRKKFWDSLTGRAPKHKVTQCIKKMQGTSITDPGAFCAALADRVIPGWREEAAKERSKKAVRRETPEQPLRARRDYGESDDGRRHSRMPGDEIPEQDRSRLDRRASEWITRDEMRTLCPPCAERMRRGAIARVRASVVRRMLRPGAR